MVTDFQLRESTPPTGPIRHANTESATRYRGDGASVEMFEITTLLSPTGRQVHLPHPVIVRRTPTYIAIIEPLTGVHGMGEDPRAALNDFWLALAQWGAAIGDDPAAPNLRRIRAVLDQFLAA